MKKTLTLFILLFLFLSAYTQKLDLIVTAKGDSIACFIDSVTNTTIYFEMKHNNKKIHTGMNKKDITEFKHDVIEKKEYVFKPGTSYIKKKLVSVSKSVKNIQRNSLYLELNGILLSGIYERTLPVGKHAGLLIGLGINQFIAFASETNPLGKFAVMAGKNKHFFECGVYIAPFGDHLGKYWTITGYRYQGPKGFLFRADALFNIGTWTDKSTGEEETTVGFLAGISFGYSF